MNKYRKNSNRGFTLVELLIALGILASCLSISMGLFAAAIYENNNSFKIVLGRIIGENGMATAEQTFSETKWQSVDAANCADAQAGKLTLVPDSVISADSKIFGAATDGRGYNVLARKVSGDAWLFVVNSYLKFDPSATLTVKEVDGVSIGWNPDTSANDSTWITMPTGSSDLRIGSPVIIKELVSLSTSGASQVSFRLGGSEVNINRDPLSSDNQGVGKLWRNTVTGNWFVCTSNVSGVTTWSSTSPTYGNIQTTLAENLPGTWATVIEMSADGSQGRLDRTVLPWYVGKVTLNVYLIQESGQTRLSPSIGTFAIRTFPRQ